MTQQQQYNLRIAAEMTTDNAQATLAHADILQQWKSSLRDIIINDIHRRLRDIQLQCNKIARIIVAS
jgi:hypothetical protein